VNNPSHQKGRLVADDFTGTWRLERWETEMADGAVSRPFGDHPIGYVVYTSDGHMITTISQTGRVPIGGDLLSAPAEARSEAFGTFVAYSGTFRVEDHDVIHGVEMSLLPDWVGTEQRRQVKLSKDGSSLMLSTDPLSASGEVVRHHLCWKRIGG
jgi:hypothetical protein